MKLITLSSGYSLHILELVRAGHLAAEDCSDGRQIRPTGQYLQTRLACTLSVSIRQGDQQSELLHFVTMKMPWVARRGGVVQDDANGIICPHIVHVPVWVHGIRSVVGVS